MKSKTYLFLTLVGLAVASSACKRCVTCEQAGYNDIEVCRNNYSTPQQYDIVVNSYESAGYDCN